MTSSLMFFIFTLSICYFIVRYSNYIENKISNFGLYLTKNAFPGISEYEFNKFAILRIIFGLILIIRSIYILYFLLPSEYYSLVGIWTIAELIAGFLILIGFLTQWALVFLIMVMWHIGDKIISKGTLGNDVAAILAVMLLLVNAGKYISFDSIIIKRIPIIRRLFLYYSGAPTIEQIALVKFTALMSYWAVCVYSIAIHLNEPAWTSGVAGPLLLTNNFMANGSELFATLFTSNESAVYVAKISLWIMMLWYPLILPFVLFGGIFRKYIIVWGWMFIGLSYFVLILGSLAEIEAILWLGLFWSKIGFHRKILIFFDDRCNLCDKTIQFITFVDVFRVVKLRPISLNLDALAELEIDKKEALTDLYGVIENNGQVKSGYDFYIQLSKTLVLLWPFVPFLILGKLFKVGPVLYRFIARRRERMFGVCKVPRHKFVNLSNILLSRSYVVSATVLHVTFLTIFYLAAIPLPYLNIHTEKNIGSNAAHFYGIAPINVFNKTDLKMAENWFVLDSIDFNERVPLFTDKGTRLLMHKSDRIYFGYTLRFRRGVIGTNNCQFEQWKEKIDYLSNIYLHLRGVNTGSYSFTFKQLYQPLPDWDLIIENKYLINQVSSKCTVKYSVNYSG